MTEDWYNHVIAQRAEPGASARHGAAGGCPADLCWSEESLGFLCPPQPAPCPAAREEQHLLLQCVTLVEPSKSVLVLPGQVMQWFWPNSGW